jgi:cysteine desulfurase / selenocysteine lyase
LDELAANITPATKLVCMTWVHSFSGFAVDGRSLGELCRANGISLVLNVSQGLGTRPLDVSTFPVDAITSVGFKWLCGPYGTGFCWLRPELRESLRYNQAYWLAMQTADDLAGDQNREPELKNNLGARAYDVFGTANFFNFKPWTTSIEYLLDQGIAQIATHNDGLVERFIAGLDRDKFDITSPEQGLARSTLILISHKQPGRNAEIYSSLRERGIYPAFRGGKLRFAPHLYNTSEDIDSALAVLNMA